MKPAFLHQRGGGVSLVLDPASMTIRYFGADLGENTDVDALFAARPIEKWGARLDAPKSARPHLLGAATFQFGIAEQTGVAEVQPLVHSGTSPGEMNAALAPMGLEVPQRLSTLRIVEGDWCGEFRITRLDNPLGLIYASRRGRHGHDRYPAIIFSAPNTNETSGEAIAVLLAWSGSFEFIAERTRSGNTLLTVRADDASPYPSARERPVLTKGTRASVFPTGAYDPTRIILVYSADGLNGLSQKLHAHCPAPFTSTPRPVHLNTWEAIYFDHTEEALTELARRAAALSVERFVLDDGWFKGRKDDTAGLGDWTPDSKKYPAGLGPLISRVREQRMEFGLWVEPEMVNRDSDLYRSHPDWVLHRNGSEPQLMRNQLALDLSKTAVIDHLFAELDTILSAHPISYIKWDMNRDLTDDPYADDFRANQEGYVRGLYNLIDRLRAKHPALEIETCASGGGRCDYGMLARADRVWVSDSNDALDRLRINRGASHFLPLRVMGTHVGPEICHTTGRRLSLDLRAHIAMFGHFGLELDVRQLSDRDIDRLRTHIANYKWFRNLIHDGLYWRIESPEPDHLLDAVTSPAKDEALLRVVRVCSSHLGQGTTALIPGLDPEKIYAIAPVRPLSKSVEDCLAPALREGNLRLSGRMLAAAGLSLYLPRPETSLLLHLKA